MKRSLIPILASLCGLAACAPADETHPTFGNAVRQNMAAHVINPDPHPADMPPPEMDGARSNDAIERYREGKVIRPVPLNTTTIVSGSKK